MSEEAIQQLVTDMMKTDGKSGGLEKAIAEVNQNLQKIENIEDISQLPYKLIEDVFRISTIMELEGSKQSMKFAADSKRRLLDSIAKIKSIEIQSPRTCQECPNNPQRIRQIIEDRKQKDDLVKQLELTPDQYKTLEGQWTITFNPPQ